MAATRREEDLDKKEKAFEKRKEEGKEKLQEWLGECDEQMKKVQQKCDADVEDIEARIKAIESRRQSAANTAQNEMWYQYGTQIELGRARIKGIATDMEKAIDMMSTRDG